MKRRPASPSQCRRLVVPVPESSSVPESFQVMPDATHALRSACPRALPRALHYAVPVREPLSASPSYAVPVREPFQFTGASKAQQVPTLRSACPRALPEASEHTSIKQRVDHVQEQGRTADLHAVQGGSVAGSRAAAGLEELSVAVNEGTTFALEAGQCRGRRIAANSGPVRGWS